MAVTDVKRMTHTATQTVAGTNANESYRVTFDAVPTDIRDALTASFGGVSVPAIGGLWPGSTTIWCKKIGPVQQHNDSRLVYDVAAEYSNISAGGVVDDDPLSRPADISWGFDVVERVVETDFTVPTPLKVVNSAGDPLDPTVVDEMHRLVCTIERNVSSFSPADAFAKIDTLNDAGITIAGVTVTTGQALMKEYSGTAIYAGGTDYVRERFVIQFAVTHSIVVNNLGFHFLDASDSGDRKHVLDDEGFFDTQPHFLKTTSTAGDDNGQTPTTLTFVVKDSSSWASLNLPGSFPDT